MKAYYETEQVEKKNVGPISRQMKICIACGSTHVQEYNLGISCNTCGTCFYFGRNFER